MNTTLAEMLEYSASYIDDVIVYSTTFEEHLQHLEIVLQKLKDLGLTVKPSKCQFAVQECTFLGHKVGRGVVQLLEAKVEVIRSIPKPKKKKDMQAFLGLANYYRRFIAGFASIAVPLTDATRKIAPDKINWSHEMEEAFQQIKDNLTSNPVLSSPDTQKPFCL